MRVLLLIIPAILLFSSCANKFSIQKRKYNKGFYFASSKKTEASKTQSKCPEQKNKAGSDPGEKPTEEIVTLSMAMEENFLPSNNITVQNVTASVKKEPVAISSYAVKPVHLGQNISIQNHSSSASKNPCYDIFNGGGFYAVFGIISAIISLIIAIIYLYIVLSAFSGAGFAFGGVLVFVGIIILAAIVIGVLLVNSD